MDQGQVLKKKCFFCPFESLLIETVFEHTFQVHSKRPILNVLTCPHCSNFKATSLDLIGFHTAKDHAPNQANQFSHCHLCDFQTVDQLQLGQHLVSNHLNSCMQCSFSTVSPQLLKEHVQSHHHAGGDPGNSKSKKRPTDKALASASKKRMTIAKDENVLVCPSFDGSSQPKNDAEEKENGKSTRKRHKLFTEPVNPECFEMDSSEGDETLCDRLNISLPRGLWTQKRKVTKAAKVRYSFPQPLRNSSASKSSRLHGKTSKEIPSIDAPGKNGNCPSNSSAQQVNFMSPVKRRSHNKMKEPRSKLSIDLQDQSKQVLNERPRQPPRESSRKRRPEIQRCPSEHAIESHNKEILTTSNEYLKGKSGTESNKGQSVLGKNVRQNPTTSSYSRRKQKKADDKLSKDTPSVEVLSYPLKQSGLSMLPAKRGKRSRIRDNLPSSNSSVQNEGILAAEVNEPSETSQAVGNSQEHHSSKHSSIKPSSDSASTSQTGNSDIEPLIDVSANEKQDLVFKAHQSTFPRVHEEGLFEKHHRIAENTLASDVSCQNKKPLRPSELIKEDKSRADCENKDLYMPKEISSRLKGKLCLECNYNGPKRFDTVRHIRNVHLRKKGFECNLCSFSSEYLNSLKDHFSNNHTDEEGNVRGSESPLPIKSETKILHFIGEYSRETKDMSDKDEEPILGPEKAPPGIGFARKKTLKKITRLRNDRHLYELVVKPVPSTGHFLEMRPVVRKFFKCAHCLFKTEVLSEFENHNTAFHSLHENATHEGNSERGIVELHLGKNVNIEADGSNDESQEAANQGPSEVEPCQNKTDSSQQISGECNEEVSDSSQDPLRPMNASHVRSKFYQDASEKSHGSNEPEHGTSTVNCYQLTETQETVITKGRECIEANHLAIAADENGGKVKAKEKEANEANPVAIDEDVTGTKKAHCETSPATGPFVNDDERFLHRELVRDNECTLCRFRHDSPTIIMKHLVVGHASLDSLKCIGCDWKAPNLTELVKHLKESHRKPIIFTASKLR